MAIVARGSEDIWESFQSANSNDIVKDGGRFTVKAVRGVLYNNDVLRSEFRTKILGQRVFQIKVAYDLTIETDLTGDGSAVVTQVWDGGSPTNSIRWDYNNNMLFYRLYREGQSDDKLDFDLTTLRKGEKIRLGFILNGKEDGSGSTQIYINGNQVVNYNGRTLFGSIDSDPYVKFGIYDDDDLPSGMPDRRVIFDNIIIGDSNTSIQELELGVVVVEPPVDPPTDPPIEPGEITLTFVNAQYEVDIAPAVDGSVISIENVETHKISVRANCPGADNVSFYLYGAREHEFTDYIEPFSLWGDDGNGNYYYGQGMVAGDYRLVVDAYNEEGFIIAKKQIKFSITDGSENEEPPIDPPTEPPVEPPTEPPTDKEDIESNLKDIEGSIDSIRESNK